MQLSTSPSQRLDLFAEAVVVLGAAEVQLADRVDPVALLPQPVAPAGDGAVVGDAVVPAADVVDVAPGLQRGARRHTHGAVDIGVLEAGAAGRQPVEGRCLHQQVTLAAHGVAAVLVREDEQQVGGLHAPAPQPSGRIGSKPRARLNPTPMTTVTLPSSDLPSFISVGLLRSFRNPNPRPRQLR